MKDGTPRKCNGVGSSNREIHQAFPEIPLNTDPTKAVSMMEFCAKKLGDMDRNVLGALELFDEHSSAHQGQ